MRTRSARVSRRSQELPRSVHWISQDFGKRAVARREGFACSPGMVGAEMVFCMTEVDRSEAGVCTVSGLPSFPPGTIAF